MEHEDDFKYSIALAGITDYINARKDMSENCEFWIDCAKGLFQNINKSLDSIIDEGGSYFFTPYLIEIIKSSGKWNPKLSKEQAIEMKKYFSSVQEKLDKMKQDPKEFYRSEESNELSDFLGNLLPIYSQ